MGLGIRLLIVLVVSGVAGALGACFDEDPVIATAERDLAARSWIPAATPLVSRLPRYDQVWQAGTHNSYWVKRDNVYEIAASGTQERLLDQLLFEHVRTFEIDIHKDDPIAGNFTVYHTDKQSNSLCSPLAECLKQLQVFHHAVPEHEVVTVVLELKEILQYNFDGNHTPEDLDAILEQYLGPALYRPADLLARCPAGSTLRACARSAGWPTIHELRGKFVFAVLGNWRADVLPGPAESYQGHGPAGWVEYATWGGGAADRSAFPMESFWIRFNEGPSTDTVDPARVDAARAASVFVQIEQEQIFDPRVQEHLADHRILRAGGSNDTLADQELRRSHGAQIIQTDAPWLQVDDRGPRQPFRLQRPDPGVDDGALQEPGQRLLLTMTPGDDRRAFVPSRSPATGDVTWETLPSSTRPPPDPAYANPARPRGRGCLRAAAGSRPVHDAGADAISICRHTFDGNWYTSKPVGEDAVITVELVRGGRRSTQTFVSASRTAAGPGDLLRLAIARAPDGSTCATASSAAQIVDGAPGWVPLATHCFAEPLPRQGIAVNGGDVLFVATRRTTSAGTVPVSSTDLAAPVRLVTGAPVSDPGYVLSDLSWPAP